MNRKFLDVNIINFAEVEPFHNDNAMMARWQEGESLVLEEMQISARKHFLQLLSYFILLFLPLPTQHQVSRKTNAPSHLFCFSI